jgi:hypothetical protein
MQTAVFGPRKTAVCIQNAMSVGARGQRALAQALVFLDDGSMRIAGSGFVMTLVVAVAAVVPAVPASGAVPGAGQDVVCDRVLGERAKDLHDPMVTRQGTARDPSMSTVTGADGVGCWSEHKDDGSTVSTCSELMLHTVTA